MKKYQLKSNRRDRSAGNGSFFTSSVAGAVALLSSLAFLVIAPGFFTPHSAFADSINMTVSSSIALDVLPSNPSGTVSVLTPSTSNISITTDSALGYTLTLQGSGSSAPSLTGTGGSIGSISSEQSSPQGFTSGTWGYKPTKYNGTTWADMTIGDYNTGYYLPGPTSTGDVLDVTDSANDTANQYNISLASKIGSETAIGSYSGSFTVVAVTNVPPVITFDQAFAAAGKTKVPDTNYYALQDMTPSICESITLLQTGTLVDTRDGNKTYSVAKLDDTNCWMTQNLTLGSSSLGKITLTSDNSDVSSNFELSAPTTTSFSTSNYDVVNYRNYTSNSTNYYNWYTATAGTGKKATTAYTAATSSICPKGWRLPNGSPAANTAGEWAELLYAAGITSTLATSTTSVSYATGGKNKMTAAPYNIATTYGYFNTTGTAPTGTSYTSFWTNRVSFNTTRAWSTYIGSSSATLNYATRYEYQGLPMRCVAHNAGTQPTITYDANGGTGAPSPTTAGSVSEFSQSITLSSTVPTRTNYVFAGWATSASATIPEYSAGGTITTNKDTTLYAVWDLDCRTVPSMLAMQNYDKSLLVDTGDSATVCDTRDGSSYLIAKLADGNVWMLDNLRLGSGNTTTLTSSDTNIASDPGIYTLPASGTANFDSTNGYTNAAINTDSKYKATTSYGSGSGKIGTYYNYCAATAGTYCYAAGSGTGNA